MVLLRIIPWECSKYSSWTDENPPVMYGFRFEFKVLRQGPVWRFWIFFYHSQVQCVLTSRFCPLLLCFFLLKVFEVQHKAWWTCAVLHEFYCRTLLDCLFLAQIHVCFLLLEDEFGMCCRHTSAKIAQSDPSWNPSIAGRELLKPKFYDVWFEVSGNNQAILPKGSTLPEVHLAHTVKTPEIHVHSSRLLGKEVSSSMHGIVDCGSAVKEMQQLMKVQLQVNS